VSANKVPLLSNKRLRVTLREDRAVFLVCTAIAFLFWFFVKLSQDYESEWTFDMTYLLPPEKAFLEAPPDKVTANVEGRGWDLMYLYFFRRHDTVQVQVDGGLVPSLNERSLIARLSPFVTSSNLDITGVKEEYIDLSYELRDSKKVPVRLAKELLFMPEHYQTQPATLSPDSITISGPESLIRSLQEWPTDSGQIKGLRSDFRKRIPLQQPARKVLDIQPQEVELFVAVEPFVEKTFLFVPVQVKNAPDSLKIFPSSVKIACVIGMSQFGSIEADDFSVVADLENFELNSENNTVPFFLADKPEAAKSVRISPPSGEFFFQVTPDSLTLPDIAPR
jgi:hypothetical protein